MTRDSSPPEAPLAIGSSGAPGCATITISTWSTPSGPALTQRPSTCTASDRAGRPRRCATRTRTTALAIASWSSSLVTSTPSRSAASHRRRDNLSAAAADLGPQRIQPGLQFGQPMLGGIEVRPVRRWPPGPGQHGVDVLAVAAGQRAQRGLPGQHLLQPGRIGVQTGQVTGQLGGHVDQRQRRLLQLAGQLGQRAGRCRIRRGRAAPPAPDRPRSGASASSSDPDSAVSATLAADRSPSTFSSRRASAISSTSSPGSGRQRGDLGQSQPQQLFPLGAFPCPGPPIGQVGGQLLPLGAQLAVARRVRRPVRRIGRARTVAARAAAARSPRTGRAPRSAGR